MMRTRAAEMNCLFSFGKGKIRLKMRDESEPEGIEGAVRVMHSRSPFISSY